MTLHPITTDMTAYQVADALLLAPFSRPDVWRKRLAELRRQGRQDEAEWVEATFPEYLTRAAAAAHEKTGDMIAAWATQVCDGRKDTDHE